MLVTDQKRVSSSVAIKTEVGSRQENESWKLAEGSVEGTVSSAEGPVPNARISLGVIDTFSNQKGNFLLNHFPPGIATIRVEKPGYYNSETNIVIEAGENRKGLMISLNEVTGTIEGTIRDEKGAPIADAEVSGVFKLAKPPITQKTDSIGHYIFNNIPVGNYLVRVNATGYTMDGAKATVEGAKTALIDFKLSSGNLAIDGKVTGKQGGIPINSEICLLRNGVLVGKQVARSEDGRFIFNRLVPDVYEVEVISQGYTSKGWRGRLEKSEEVNFELEVEPSSCNSL